jgi:large subunit ribosomal protein L10
LQKLWKFDNDYGDFTSVLTGNSAIFISDIANAPGKNYQRFQKKSKAKPVLKGAYINLKFTLEMIN